MIFQQLVLVKVALAQHFSASPFKKGNVTGVINHAACIGVFVINTDGPSEQRITHSTSRIAI
jgi:hypothetical protein